MKRQFVVTFEMPAGLTVDEAAEYVRQAVACWAGSKDPESAIYDLDKSSVRVEAVKAKRKPQPTRAGQ